MSTGRFGSRNPSVWWWALIAPWVFVGCGGGEVVGSAPDATAPIDLATSGAVLDMSVPIDLAPPLDFTVSPDLRSPLLRPFDWTGVIGTGQSLSVGATAGIISSFQPFENLKLGDPNYTGDLTGAPGVGAMLIPLVEPIRGNNAKFPGGPDYPNNIQGETPHAAMANEISNMAYLVDGADYVTFHSAVGESGQSITVIRKNGTGNSYAAALYEARAATAFAKQAGKRFGYAAITLTHGETDWDDMNYEADIHQLWSDYNTDLKAITGQTQDVLMLVSQQGTFPGAPGSAPSTLAEWQMGRDYPGQILCVGPKYQYEYSGDHIHLTANGYRRMGQKYAQVYFQTVVLGQTWKPLQPNSVTRNGATLTITFDVPVPPLLWDPRIPAPHQTMNTQWSRGRGFEVSDSMGSLGIVSVDIQGDDQVVLVMDRMPVAGLTLAYAMTQEANAYAGGTVDGRQGQLRDSESRTGYDEEAIPCNVVQGSAMVTAAASDFSRRSVGDVVTSSQLPDDVVIVQRPAVNQVVLSSPWTQASGATILDVHNDMHNYLVQFSLPVN